MPTMAVASSLRGFTACLLLVLFKPAERFVVSVSVSHWIKASM